MILIPPATQSHVSGNWHNWHFTFCGLPNVFCWRLCSPLCSRFTLSCTWFALPSLAHLLAGEICVLAAFLTSKHFFCSPCVLSSWESLGEQVWLGWQNRLCGTQLPERLGVQHLMSEAVLLHCVCVGWELRAASRRRKGGSQLLDN